MAVDGTVIDVPDSPGNARVFWCPGTRPGTKAAFPKVRLVLLVETGTHLRGLRLNITPVILEE
jgi:hypothetical protein